MTDSSLPSVAGALGDHDARSPGAAPPALCTNDAALREALAEAAETPELAPLVRVVESLKAPAAAA
ncbi:hypothetical protein QF032_003970 [Streptomyces achromogenes]|nr:hypothetical protein [Streptomyces achromogenes]